MRNRIVRLSGFGLRLSMPAALLALLAASGPSTSAAQIGPGDILSLEELERDLPSNDRYPFVREHRSTERVSLTTMMTHLSPGEPTLGIQEDREVVVLLYARDNHPLDGYDQAVVAVPDGSGFRIINVQATAGDYLEDVSSFAPPGPSPPVRLLRATSAQTGSGGIVEELLYALEEGERLVRVSTGRIEWGDALEEGEYACCGSYTSFRRDLIELQVFFTKTGRSGITHRSTVQYELRGEFEYDPSGPRFRPAFELVPGAPTPREPAAREPQAPRRFDWS